jgi:hypothetical protein
MPLLLAAPFVVIIAGLMVWGLASMQQSASSGFVGWLEQTLGRAAAFAIPTAQAIISLTKWVTHKLGEHFAGIERLTVGWVAGLYQYVERVGAMTLLWPLELFKVTYWLIWHEIPRQIAALPTRAGKVIHQVTSRVVRVERTIVKLPKLTKAQAKALIGAAVATYIGPYLTMLHWLRTHFHALTAVLPHTLPIPFGRTIAAIRARLRRLERGLTKAGALALVVAAIGEAALRLLRCKKVLRTGSRVCGMDSGLLDSLLLDSLAIVGAISVVEFAKGLRSIEDEAVTILGRLVKEFPSA